MTYGEKGKKQKQPRMSLMLLAKNIYLDFRCGCDNQKKKIHYKRLTCWARN